MAPAGTNGRAYAGVSTTSSDSSSIHERKWPRRAREYAAWTRRTVKKTVDTNVQTATAINPPKGSLANAKSVNKTRLGFRRAVIKRL